jgi:maltooligosyltrehalose trehalohydrolase
MWMRDFHIDGLRIDAVHAFVDRSAIHFLEQLASEVDALSGLLGRRLVLIAESDLNDPRLVTPREAGGLGMDAQWSDDFHHALFTVLCPHGRGGYYSDFGSFGQLAKALERSFVYDGIYSRHRGRMHGRPAESLSPHRFLGFIQNHDQVGNRAIGDRVREIAGFARAKIAAAIVLTSPFIPMLFQGEEWAASSPFQYFADHADPEMARLVSEGRKEEFSAFGWDAQLLPDPEDPETFLRSKLNWDELTGQEHIEMLEWYRKLIRLRQVSPSLNDGEPGHTQVFYNEKQMWLRVVRAGLTVNCNLGMSAHSFAVPEGSRLVLCSRESLAFSGSELVLPPDSVAIVAL